MALVTLALLSFRAAFSLLIPSTSPRVKVLMEREEMEIAVLMVEITTVVMMKTVVILMVIILAVGVEVLGWGGRGGESNGDGVGVSAVVSNGGGIVVGVMMVVMIIMVVAMVVPTWWR